MTTSKARGGRRSGRRGARRAVEWFDFQINLTVAGSGGQNTVNLTANLQDDEKKGMTLVRTLIQLAAMPIATGAGSVLAMGIVMIEDDALAAGSVPEPGDNIQKPGWLWKTLFSSSTAVVNARADATLIKEDLRGMRKFAASGSDLVLVAENIQGTVTVNIDGLIRMLWMKS